MHCLPGTILYNLDSDLINLRDSLPTMLLRWKSLHNRQRKTTNNFLPFFYVISLLSESSSHSLFLLVPKKNKILSSGMTAFTHSLEMLVPEEREEKGK